METLVYMMGESITEKIQIEKAKSGLIGTVLGIVLTLIFTILINTLYLDNTSTNTTSKEQRGCSLYTVALWNGILASKE